MRSENLSLSSLIHLTGLLFQDYFVLGSLIMSGIGAGMFVLDREKMYEKAQAIGLIGLFFPFFFMLMLVHPITIRLLSVEVVLSVEFGPKFDLIAQAPLLTIMILHLLWIFPIFTGTLRGKGLALDYLLLGATAFIGGIYALPALFSFALSTIGAAIFGAVGTKIYLTERKKEMKMRKILEFMRSRGETSLEDVMDVMRMPDAEAEKLLYEMWNANLIERVEGRESAYKVIERREAP